MDHKQNQEPEQSTSCEQCSGHDTQESCSCGAESPKETTSRKGGKRVKQRSGCFSKFVLLLSLLLIVAAAVIVVRDIVPMAKQVWAERNAPQAEDVEKVTPPKSIVLSEYKASFTEAGETLQLSTTLTPEDANAPLQWTSSDPAVVTVSESGLLTAVGTGTATVTAAAGDIVSQECTVTCKWTESATIGKLSLNRKDFTMGKVGETFQMKIISQDPSDTDLKPVWKSKDSTVATISAEGVVTAVAKGKTEVTAILNGKTLVCIVRCNF